MTEEADEVQMGLQAVPQMAQMHGGRDFVDVLPACALRPYSVDFNLMIQNGNR